VLVEALWGHTLAVAAEACLTARVPYVVQLHGQLMPWALCHKRWKKRIYLGLFGKRYLDKAVALQCTDLAEAEAVARLRFRAPTLIVPNSIDALAYGHMPMRGALRQRLQIPDDAKLLLFLGRLSRIKRPDIAIDVVAAVHSSGQDAYLILAGPDEDSLIPILRSQAQALGCSDRVHFTGLLSTAEVTQVLADADLLLMPSEVEENFGMSALEALAAGVPVLVSTGVPVGRWAQQAGAGTVVACETEAFRQAASRLLSSRNELRAMGERGRTLARDKFDISVVARHMLANFESLVTSDHPLSDNMYAI
jgi:glycosyltransferase involved in cell wall biosynthesis